MAVILKSPAKINLVLDVIDKRPDGYHNIETIFQRIDLSDTITIKKHSKIEITCDNPTIPLDEKNLVYKVAQNLDCNVKIHIEKRIPPGVGLGGGSSNAAMAIIGINKLFSLGMSKKDMFKIANKIGADVPFFLTNESTCFATGIGEIIEPLKNKPLLDLLLVIPNINFPEKFKKTKWAYDQLDKIMGEREIEHPNIRTMLDAVNNNDINAVIRNLGNIFESVMLHYDEIKHVKDLLAKEGVPSLLSGAGPCVFGILNNIPKERREKVRAGLLSEKMVKDVLLAKTV